MDTNRPEEKNMIIDALKLLKMVCSSYQKICDIDGCTKCPLRKDNFGNCAILMESPSNYEINDSDEWRAFR